MIAPASGWPTGYVDSSDTPRSVEPFTHVGWRDVLVPLATWSRPLWMATGIVGLHLMPAVWVSTQLRPRIGYRGGKTTDGGAPRRSKNPTALAVWSVKC